MQKESYVKLLPSLKTGDLILFSGQYPISKLVEKLEHSMWSHVGMVVRPDPLGEVYFFESTALTNLEDEWYHDHQTGPKVVKLLDRLKTYGQDVTPYVPPLYALRSLDEETRIDSVKLDQYIKEVHGIPNPGEWQMIEEVVEGRIFSLPSKRKDYTCSRLIGEVYEMLNIATFHIPLNGLMPADFSSGGKIELKQGKLEKEILIELNPASVKEAAR
ncbi:hypothetical protein [Bacillus sp. B1-b2]|uniref:hypothetical protein n=1 Tax=Bacillus sp. B1-b2 TaxID=2653201 RepID=UPI0012627A56|nr:hypothetical protein [Bacillus sp. B1-b2]KAB7671244.1 hypothetical protein F9279_06955 [Bacillus sp. B1-b2]